METFEMTWPAAHLRTRYIRRTTSGSPTAPCQIQPHRLPSIYKTTAAKEKRNRPIRAPSAGKNESQCSGLIMKPTAHVKNGHPWLLSLCGLLLLACVQLAVAAATLTVTNLDDSGPGTLRQLISD